MPRPPGERSGIMLFARAADSPHLSKARVQRYPLLSSWALRLKGVQWSIQLKRVPRAEPCDAEMAQNIYQEIIDSIKECLYHRWDCTQLMEEPGWRSTGTSRLDPMSKFQQKNCAAYDHFRDIKEGSCEESLAVAQDAHRQALVAAALLKDKIERVGNSISHGQRQSGSQRWLQSQVLSGSHRQSHSHCWRRSRAAQCSRESSVRRTQSPSLLCSRQWVSPSIEADNSRPLSWADKMVKGNHTDWSQPKAEDLGCPLMLDPWVQEFLSGGNHLRAAKNAGMSLINWECQNHP